MKNNFIGIGRNPDGPDLPLGFGMQLAQNPDAMDTFATMSKDEKAALINHIQGAKTGEDARNRIAETITNLSSNQTKM